MSKKEMEKNLEYGDCFNFFGALSSVFMEAIGTITEKIVDKNTKKD
jgi:hypothetical protein